MYSQNSASFRTDKLRKGCYRTRRDDSYAFGQVTSDGRNWYAEIRVRETGEIIRHAGIWQRKRDALTECQHILSDVRYSA